MEIRFVIDNDTKELRKVLENAEWVKEYENDEETQYTTEIGEVEYTKCMFIDGSILITDDVALAAGDYMED